MMFNLHMFTRASHANANRQEPENERVFIDFFWSAALVCAALLIVVSLGYGAWQFWGVWQDDAEASSASSGAAPSFNRNDLKTVLDAFGSRRVEYDARKGAPPTINDPSK